MNPCDNLDRPANNAAFFKWAVLIKKLLVIANDFVLTELCKDVVVN